MRHHKHDTEPASNSISTPDFASSGLPAGYEALYNNNPYLNYEYQMSGWDRIGNFLGFRTSEDRTREEYAQRSKEYIAQLQALAREEEYNSESAQSERQKEAGINPALNGVNPSQASEFNESPMTLPDIQRNNADDVNSFFSTFTGIVNTILGVGQGILSLNRNHLDNLQAKVDLNNDIFGFGKSLGIDLVNTDDVRGLFGDSMEGLNTTEVVTNKLKKLGFSNKEAKKYAYAFSQGYSYKDSVKGQKELVNDFNELSNSSKQYASNRSIGASGLQISPVLSQTLGAISDYELQVMKLQLKYQSEYYNTISGKLKANVENKQLNYQSDYYDTTSGKLKGQAENTTNRYTSQSLGAYTDGDYFKIKAEYDSMMINYQKDLIKLNQNIFNKIDDQHPIFKSLVISGITGLQQLAADPLSVVGSFKN